MPPPDAPPRRKRCRPHHWILGQPRIFREGQTWHRHTDARCKRCGRTRTFKEQNTPADAQANYAHNKGPSAGGRAPNRTKKRPKAPSPTPPSPVGEGEGLDHNLYNLGGGGSAGVPPALPKSQRWRTARW